MKRKKILIIMPRFPYPVIGGDKLRIYEICKNLSNYHELTLLTFCESWEEMEYKIPNDGVFKNVKRVLLTKFQSYLNCALGIFSQLPLQTHYYYSKKFKKYYNELVKDNDFVLCHLIRLCQYVAEDRHKLILEMTDAISLNYERIHLSSIGNLFRYIIYKYEKNKLLKYEIMMVKTALKTILVSEIDKKYLIYKYQNLKQNSVIDFQERIMVCTNGVDMKKYSSCRDVRTSAVILFIGNMNTLQNFDACIYFIQNVLPLLSKLNNFKFRIVGKMSRSVMDKFAKFHNVELCANVDDVRVYVRDAFVAVAPIRIGAGIQNKVLEYMAMGIPVIASEIAAEGLDVRNEKEILIAKDPDEYVNYINLIWGKELKYANLPIHALNYVYRMHNWESCLRGIVEFIDLQNELLHVA